MNAAEAVREVLVELTGLSLETRPVADRYHTVVRMLNKALRHVARSSDWSWYHARRNLGHCVPGTDRLRFPSSVRVRRTGDDAVVLYSTTRDGQLGEPVRWAYFVPDDALHKYRHPWKLWAAVVQNNVHFSRPFRREESSFQVVVPVIRRYQEIEFDKTWTESTMRTRLEEQEIDFEDPDAVIAWACYYLAQSDPVLQPRVQTLQEYAQNMLYQLVERDNRHTDTPYVNPFTLGIDGDIASGRPGFGIGDHRGPLF